MKKTKILLATSILIFFSCTSALKNNSRTTSNNQAIPSQSRSPANVNTVLENIGLHDFDDSNDEWLEITNGDAKENLFKLIEAIDFENSSCRVRRGIAVYKEMITINANKFICSMQDDETYLRVWQYRKNTLVYKIMANKYIIGTDSTFLSQYFLSFEADRRSVNYMKKKECTRNEQNNVSCIKSMEWSASSN